MNPSAQDDVERTTERPGLTYTPDLEDDTPAETSEDVSEDFDLPAARAQNDSKLKSLFEGIFAKYSQDFTDVGDEIDLETGDIVVDNGHILGMQDEGDNGGQPRPWLFQAGLGEPVNPATSHGDDIEGDKHESMPSSSSLNGSLPDTPPLETPYEVPPSEQQQSKQQDSLDFVFTFKASGATGLSPITKTQLSSQPTNMINAPNPITTSKPQDPIWAVPDLPQPFSTPTTETRKINVGVSPVVRSPSPPGSGSLWAITRPSRPRTESKPKATPSRRKPAAKRKYLSSPVTRDWSFAKVPDGNESDDPLQDYEPSPTPSKMRIIRGNRPVPVRDGENPPVHHNTTPSKMRPSHGKGRQPTIDIDVASVRPHYVPPNVPSTIHKTSQDDESDVAVIKNAPDLETQIHEPFVSVLATTEDGQDIEDEGNNQEGKTWLDPPQGEHSVDSTMISTVEDETEAGDMYAQEERPPDTEPQAIMAFDSTSHHVGTTSPGTKVPSTEFSNTTPSKRRGMTPDEAKLIMRVMHKENRKASDVIKSMPTLEYQAVWHWFFYHWTHRLSKPPRLSAPWSDSELATLTRLSNQTGLSWADIQREFPRRSRAEIEFELLHTFVNEPVTSAAEGSVEQPDVPAADQSLDSSQEVWVQAEENLAEPEPKDSLHSVEQDRQELSIGGFSSPSTAPGYHYERQVQPHVYANSS